MSRPPSPAEMRDRGWTRVASLPRQKINCRWEHTAGWTLVHCGHPTALRPWILTAPDGGEVRTGVWSGNGRDKGTTWEGLARPVIWVAGHEEDPAYGGRPRVRVESRDPGPMWGRVVG